MEKKHAPTEEPKKRQLEFAKKHSCPGVKNGKLLLYPMEKKI